MANKRGRKRTNDLYKPWSIFSPARAMSRSPKVKYIIDAVIIEYPTGVPIPANPNNVIRTIINSKVINISISR